MEYDVTTKKGTLSFEDVRKDFVARRDFDKLISEYNELVEENSVMKKTKKNKIIKELENIVNDNKEVLAFYEKRFGEAKVCFICDGTGEVDNDDPGYYLDHDGKCSCDNGIDFEPIPKKTKTKRTLIE